MLLSKEVLTRYLPGKLGVSSVDVSDVTQFTRGSSRETWFITYRSPDVAKPESVVLRRDMPDGSIIPFPLKHEFAIYYLLAKTEVPVAKPLWWEEDPGVLQGGQPFYVREHVEGSWEVPGFVGKDASLDDMRVAVAKEHLSKLAKVHAVDWRALRFDEFYPPPATPALAALNIVEQYQRRIEALSGEAMPILPEALEWLRENAPPAARICLCKGTNGLGEEVFRDGRIVAMSDWEESSLGDPASDFAFCQNFVQEIERDGVKKWGLVQALDYYESLSGLRISPQSVHYYHLIRALGIIEFSVNSTNSIVHRNSDNVRKAYISTELVNISKRMLASAIGLVEPVPASRYYDMVDME